jgi:NhaP-type Na+/H+ or K+/H+ antiporter
MNETIAPAMTFFPDFPVSLNILTAVGLILIAGILGARVLHRYLKVPSITGYVLTGLLIGPAGLSLVTTDILNDFVPLIDVALGVVLFELGRRVDIRWLLREKRLLATGIVISMAVFLALFFVLKWFGISTVVASMVAAIGMATSPAVALGVVREAKAEGQMSERLLNIVAIGNVLGFIGFSMGLAALHLEYEAGWQAYVLHPIYLLAGSILLGSLAGLLLIFIARYVGRDWLVQLIVVIALIAATVGLAAMLKLPSLIALLAFGIASRSLDRQHTLVELKFDAYNALLYVLLFVFAGARLEIVHLRELAIIVAAFIVVRFATTILITTASAHANGLTYRKGMLLGVALVPLSGFKIVLVQHAAGAYPEFGSDLAALMISMLVILEILGPICTRYALQAAGEANHK